MGTAPHTFYFKIDTTKVCASRLLIHSEKSKAYPISLRNRNAFYGKKKRVKQTAYSVYLTLLELKLRISPHTGYSFTPSTIFLF